MKLQADNGRENSEIMKLSELKYYARRLLSVMETHLICFETYLLPSKFSPEISRTNNCSEMLSVYSLISN